MTRTRPKLVGWRTVVLCLSIGAVLNVGVAWGLVAGFLYSVPSWRQMESQVVYIAPGHAPKDARHLDWPTSSSNGARPPAPERREDIHWRSRHGIRYTYWESPRDEAGNLSPEFSHLRTRRWRTGLPYRSLEGFAHQRADAPNEPPILEWGLETPNGDLIWLPLRPIFPGFLINTAFYAVLTLTPIVLLRLIRKARRRRRGLCPWCGYDARGLEACPECGVEGHSA